MNPPSYWPGTLPLYILDAEGLVVYNGMLLDHYYPIAHVSAGVLGMAVEVGGSRVYCYDIVADDIVLVGFEQGGVGAAFVSTSNLSALGVTAGESVHLASISKADVVWRADPLS